MAQPQKKTAAAPPSYPTPKGKKPRLEYQPPETLIVDERYQRNTTSEASQRLIRSILAAWDWNYFGVIIATDNGDGTYCVIDGQHRAEAARRHPGVRAVPVMVIDEMTLVEQAEAFASINKARVSLNALQIHRAKATAGDDRARTIARLCAAVSLTIPNNVPASKHIKPGMLICISTLYQILARHGEGVLRRTLEIAATAYANSAGDLRAQIMQGVAVAITGGVVTDDAIAARLATADAEEWIYRAKKKGGAIAASLAVLLTANQQEIGK